MMKKFARYLLAGLGFLLIGAGLIAEVNLVFALSWHSYPPLKVVDEFLLYGLIMLIGVALVAVVVSAHSRAVFADAPEERYCWYGWTAIWLFGLVSLLVGHYVLKSVAAGTELPMVFAGWAFNFAWVSLFPAPAVLLVWVEAVRTRDLSLIT